MSDKLKMGWGICASYCNFREVIDEVKKLTEKFDIYPIMTDSAAGYDTRFGNKDDFIKEIEEICGREIVRDLVGAEPLGPKENLDFILVCPCTGNTMAKLTAGITDNTVLSAIKTLRRNNKPTVLAIASNDMLGFNLKNAGELMNAKGIYFVPFKMDNPEKKPNSMISDFKMLEETIEKALAGEQIQPAIK